MGMKAISQKITSTYIIEIFCLATCTLIILTWCWKRYLVFIFGLDVFEILQIINKKLNKLWVDTKIIIIDLAWGLERLYTNMTEKQHQDKLVNGWQYMYMYKRLYKHNLTTDIGRYKHKTCEINWIYSCLFL